MDENDLERYLGHLALGYGKLQRSMPALFYGTGLLKHILQAENKGKNQYLLGLYVYS